MAIIPVLRSEDLNLTRRSPVVFLGVLPLVIERSDRYSKQKVFEKDYDAERTAVGEALTASLLAAARERGFKAEVLDTIKRDPEDPNEFDYRKIETDADVIIHVRVSDLGLLNLMTSPDYEPYVEANARFVAHASGFEMLDETFNYGVKGTRGDPYSVAADDADRWPDFEAVLAYHDRVKASWTKGSAALGKLIISKLPSPR